jgi:tryptophan synthase alpha chain
VNRIDTKFAELEAARRKALVPFVTAGDPSLEATVPVLHALVEAGADLLELGMPFSDPMADGPVIQRSSERARARGAGLDYVFRCVRTFREHDARTPIVLMGYLNPVEVRGPEPFARAAADAGVDGVLLVDLPPEEAGGFDAAFATHGIAPIRLLAPTTPPDRVERVLAGARGYLYYVSFAGVTGADALDPGAAGARIAGLRERSPVPVLAGFGIKDAASAVAMAVHADGVVVGSALVEALATAANPLRAAHEFLAPLRAALDAPGPARPLR